jgi:aspartate ammonia-lyase
VNPSIPEMVNQVCFQVMGCDRTIAAACEAGSSSST